MNDGHMYWKTSTFSQTGSNCMEAKARWRTSSRTITTGECVEALIMPTAVHIRDTKDREHGMVTVSAATWTRFLADLTE